MRQSGKHQSKPHQILVECVWSDPKNRSDKREEDHSLYFDLETLEFFVVEDLETTSVPNNSCYHSIHSLPEYLGRRPELREPIIQMLVQKLKATTL